jgi:hypothetical protein
MLWEQRVQRYLRSYGYNLMKVEKGLVFWKDEKGKMWTSNEDAMNRNLNAWEMKYRDKGR